MKYAFIKKVNRTFWGTHVSCGRAVEIIPDQTVISPTKDNLCLIPSGEDIFTSEVELTHSLKKRGMYTNTEK